MKKKSVLLTAFILVVALIMPITSVYCQEKEVLWLDIMIVLDNSGSMKKNDPNSLTQAVVKNFSKSLEKGSRLGLILFDKTAELAVPLSDVSKSRDKFLKSMEKVNYKGPLTNSPAGIERAIYELRNNGRQDARKIIIFLTDGIVDTGDKALDAEKSKWLQEGLALESKEAGIQIFGIAFTDKADFQLSQALARKTNGKYLRAFSAVEIQNLFNKIHELIKKPEPKPLPKVKSPPSISKPKKKLPETPKPVQKPKSKVIKTPEFDNFEDKKTEDLPKKEEMPIGIMLSIFFGVIMCIGIIAYYLALRKKYKSSSIVLVKPDEAPMPKADLIDIKQTTSKASFPINKNTIQIGRDEENDIVIPKEGISSFHGLIEFRSNRQFYLIDQDSSNGTYLNGKQVQGGIKLKSGDMIKFEKCSFKFHIWHRFFKSST